MITLQDIYERCEILPWSGCWIWMGALLSERSRYGKWPNGKEERAVHRLSYKARFGTFPHYLQICHKCDTPECANPDHLFAGTPADNQADKATKRRGAEGIKNGRAKLTAENIKEVRSLYALGSGVTELGKKFGLHHTTVSDIVTYKTWRTK